jgi:hypothetical protein
MILGFKPQFKGKIINGQKIHTIRKDYPGRWKAGNVIHFATGIRTKDYNQFWYGYCKSVQDIVMIRDYSQGNSPIIFNVLINNKKLSSLEIEDLARNDGFEDNLIEFINWFLPEPKWIFKGKIIHWTNKMY